MSSRPWNYTILGWLLCWGMLHAASAHAHATLLETSPPDRSSPASPPGEVVLRFNEPVSVFQVLVLDRAGRNYAPAAKVSAADGQIRAELDPLPDNHHFLVSYRAASLDSHPVGGGFSFTLGQPLDTVPSTAVRPTGPDIDPVVRGLVIGNRLLFYSSLLLAVGIGLYHRALGNVAPPTPTDNALRVGAVLVALSSGLAQLPLGGLELTGASLGQAFAWITWQSALSASIGASAVVSVAGLVAYLWLIVRTRCQLPSRLQLLAGLAALAGLGLTGHAATASPQWLSRPTVLVHLVATAFWLAALVLLPSALGRQAPRLLQAFSRLAVPAVGVLLVSGAVLMWLQVPDLTRLVSSDYGQLMALKLALVAPLLALAAFNKLRLTPRLAQDTVAVTNRLGHSIAVELMLMVLVVYTVVVMTTTPPPRVLVLARPQAEPLVLHALEAGFHISARLSSMTPGDQEVQVMVDDLSGRPASLKRLTVGWQLDSAGVEPIRREISADAPGRYRFTTRDLMLPGLWRLELEMLVDDYTLQRVQLEAPIVGVVQ